jgi:hypothetical protein
MKIPFALVGLALGLALAASAQPLEFAFQGRLLDDQGVPIASETSVFFSLWQGGDAETADSGSLAYRELASVTPDGTGIFTHVIGTGSPLDATALSPEDFATADDLFVQVAVGTQGNVLLPRTLISGTPYATQAATAQDSDLLGGEPASHYLDRANHTGDLDPATLPEQMGSVFLPAYIFGPPERHTRNFGISSRAVTVFEFPEGPQTFANATTGLASDFAPGPMTVTIYWAATAAPGVGTNETLFNIVVENPFTGESDFLVADGFVVPAADVVNELVLNTDPFDSGELMTVQIIRSAQSVNDTYTGDIHLLGVRIDYARQPTAP